MDPPHDNPTATTDQRDGAPPAWDDRWQAGWTSTDRDARVPVRVVRIDKGGITVSAHPGDARLVVAAKAVRRVVVGDVCALDDAAGRIEEILPRRTVFERRAPGAGRDELAASAKAVASNMDLVLVLQALDAGVNTARLAREMVLAWESGARPLVVLTKADRVDPTEREHQRSEAIRCAPGTDVVCVSSLEAPRAGADEADPSGGSGLAELLPHLPTECVAVLLGASGAGKSTLANALAGRPVQLTAEVREGDRRGRHTTTAGQMIPLAGNRWLIDTPGIRGVGLWHADDGLEAAFADLSPFAQRCRFDDCTHDREPGCGVTAAVDAGEIGADRLEAWYALVAEIEAVEQETEQRERALQRQENQRARHRAAGRDPDP
jgi:ribosome biogenesis GTPase